MLLEVAALVALTIPCMVIGCRQAVHVLQTNPNGTTITKHHCSWACDVTLRELAIHAFAVQEKTDN